jgi:hypothetical protein
MTNKEYLDKAARTIIAIFTDVLLGKSNHTLLSLAAMLRMIASQFEEIERREPE